MKTKAKKSTAKKSTVKQKKNLPNLLFKHEYGTFYCGDESSWTRNERNFFLADTEIKSPDLSQYKFLKNGDMFPRSAYYRLKTYKPKGLIEIQNPKPNAKHSTGR